MTPLITFTQNQYSFISLVCVETLKWRSEVWFFFLLTLNFCYFNNIFFNWLFIFALTARSYRDCHLLGMRNFRNSDFTAICWATSEVVHHFVNNNGLRSCETLNLYICSGIWGPTRHLSLKISNSLFIFRLRKPLKTSSRLAGHGIWIRDLPNACLVRYHGATSLGRQCIVGYEPIFIYQQRIQYESQGQTFSLNNLVFRDKNPTFMAQAWSIHLGRI